MAVIFNLRMYFKYSPNNEELKEKLMKYLPVLNKHVTWKFNKYTLFVKAMQMLKKINASLFFFFLRKL
jgi:hypothetical protein